MYITPTELLERYKAGERNFAGIRFVDKTGFSDVLRGADLRNIILSGAYLPHVKLYGANLQEAQLSGVYLFDADLTMANLSKSNLIGANLTDSSLRQANLTAAKLIGANLTRAKLGGADFNHIDMEESILAEVNLSQVKLIKRFPICTYALLWKTTMPDGTYIAGPKYHD